MAAAAAAARGTVAPYRLISIRFSHYNEKARWALDWHRVPYVEKTYLPVLSMAGVIWHGGAKKQGDRVSTKWSTPLLISAEGGRLQDSAAISRHIDARHGRPDTSLYRYGAETHVLEDHLHDSFGPHTRRLAYFYLMQEEQLLFDIFRLNSGAAQTALVKAAWPLVKKALGNLGLSAERAQKSRDKVLHEFDAAAARLSKSRGAFLLGEHFSAADVSFAALASPVLAVQSGEGFGGAIVPIDRLPEALGSFVRELRSHEAGQFALRLYRTHRGQRVIPWPPPHIV